MPQETGETRHSATKQASSIRRACDCCRKRKVRCNGESPCGPCRKAAIRCCYLQPPKKKGPKGLRSAQVLRALREIDEATPHSNDFPCSPNSFLDGYSQLSLSSESSPGGGSGVEHPLPPTSIAQGYAFYPTGAHGHPQPLPTDPALLAAAYAFDGTWHSAAMPATEPRWSSLESRPMLPDVANARFYPYVHIFFNNLFPIMPVIDPKIYLDHRLYSPATAMTPETHSFLCALSAATIVQLSSSVPLPSFDPLPGRPSSEGDMFVEECLRTRQRYDYISKPTSLTVITSFFLFAYYGNKEGERSEKAWHYLQESISFAEIMDLDDDRALARDDPIEAQWKRRLFWLLFITERAYAIQRRKHTRLQPSIELPLLFDSEDPRLLNGFVTLVHLYSAIDQKFIGIWRGTRQRALCSASWLAETQSSLDTVALAMENIIETQHLDISVSREWLHVLVWQMGVSNGLIWGRGQGGMRLEYPVELARRVVRITEDANPLALDSHGIGMEQKLSDIGGCVADVLRCAAGDTSDTFAHGRQYLSSIVKRLSVMRGRESRYLEPLMLKVDTLLDQGVPRGIMDLSLPPPPPTTTSDVDGYSAPSTASCRSTAIQGSKK
ncbi:hypothetical protein AAFC00_005107 [Neodothiora populina]|uniref:Zn(2)-C6 fungal-type domain-containing protein n=1 Tax=Neodothiora populina TaxID=2781224 RepID=A0ABR3PKZ8_9PEZI